MGLAFSEWLLELPNACSGVTALTRLSHLPSPAVFRVRSDLIFGTFLLLQPVSGTTDTPKPDQIAVSVQGVKDTTGSPVVAQFTLKVQ